MQLRLHFLFLLMYAGSRKAVRDSFLVSLGLIIKAGLRPRFYVLFPELITTWV